MPLTPPPPHLPNTPPCSPGDTEAVQKIALDIKILPQLLAAMETDKPVMGSLPTLMAVSGMMRDLKRESLAVSAVAN